MEENASLGKGQTAAHPLSSPPEKILFGYVIRKGVKMQPCFICNLIMPLCSLYCAVNTASLQLLGLLLGDQTPNTALLQRLGKTIALIKFLPRTRADGDEKNPPTDNTGKCK